MGAQILIAEDDPDITDMVRYNLEAAGFDVLAASDGEEALLSIEENGPDLLVLDWMLPKFSGIEVCRQVRRNKETRNLPIVMLTARGEEADRVRGLEAGADDYVTKPFSPTELTARIRAVLRRIRPALADEMLEFGGVAMDLASFRVSRDGEPIHLGPTEYRLLRHLMENAGRVYSRDQLLDIVWGRDIHIEPRTVDVHIRRLRRALNEGDKPDLIRTVRSAGYALNDRPPH